MTLHDVFIVDDHPVVGMALKILLEKHQAVSSLLVFESANEALEAVLKCENSCVAIVDIDMPQLSGQDFLKLLAKKANRSRKVLIYTGKREPAVEVAALCAGAKGFVSKDVGTDVFMRAFECVIDDQTYFTDAAVQSALRKVKNPKQEKIARLSARQHLIALRLVDGATNSEIAESLFISPKTVSAHKSKIFDKLEIQNIRQLIQLF